VIISCCSGEDRGISTLSSLTRLPSGAECSAGETGEGRRGAASRLYLVRLVRRSNRPTVSIRFTDARVAV